MLLLPSMFHGILGMITISVIALSLMVFPSVFADDSQVWTVSILEDSSKDNSENHFYPNELPVNDGDFVEWENNDSVTHSITSGLSDFPDYYGHFFEAGTIEPDEKKSVQIKIKDGLEAFYYVCEIHPWMKGKIFIAGTITSMPETLNPIQLDKSSYQTNDLVQVSGQVHQDFWGTDYQVLVYDENNNLVDMKVGDFDEESKYSIDLSTKNFESSGNYLIKLVYALPSKVAQTQFEFIKNESDVMQTIPSWVKNVGGYWCTNQIDNNEFLSAIQFLINKNIIQVDAANNGSPSDNIVPAWVKNNTCWWSDNQITDFDFLSGIEFLVNKGTIRV